MGFDRDAAFLAYGRCITDVDRIVAKPNDTPAVALLDAWALLVAAAERRLPELASEIAHVGRMCTPVVIDDRLDAMSSVTLVEADGGGPKIFVSYDGSPGAILTMAHELGHAVNLLHPAALSGTCRIAHETAAFLMEMVVLDGLSDMGYALIDELRAAFRSDYRFYGRTCALRLGSVDV